MERIDSFTLQRDDSSKSSKITQNVVKNGKAVDTSALSCVQGSELCYFAAIPDSGFYYGTGHIDAFGEAWLQVSVKKVMGVSKKSSFPRTCIFLNIVYLPLSIVWKWQDATSSDQYTTTVLENRRKFRRIGLF